MRLVLALLLVALAFPAQAQERFFQACVASAEGEEMPPGMDPSAVCGCAAQQATRAGAAPAALDALADHVPAGGGALDMTALPADVQPAAQAAMQALLGCALQLGVAGMMESGMEAVAEEMAAALAAPPAAAPAAAAAPEAAPMRNGVPPQLAARMAGQAPAQNAVSAEVTMPDGPIAGSASVTVTPPTVSPDGTVASAPTSRSAQYGMTGIRTGAGAAPRRATQASKGAAIRILD